MKNNSASKVGFPNIDQHISDGAGFGAQFRFKRIVALAQNFLGVSFDFLRTFEHFVLGNR